MWPRAEAGRDTPRPVFLVCFAVAREARFFVAGERLEGVEVLITGMGGINARHAIERALKRLRPDWVLTCGFAGGLAPGLPSGTVVYDPATADTLAGVLSRLGARPATFCSAPNIITTAVEKRALRDQCGADVVEMESQVIREICAREGIPSATIRVISDSAEEDLPLDFNRMMTRRLTMSYPKLLFALVRSPNRIPALLRFERATREAALQLGSVLRELVRQQPFARG